MDIFMAVRIRGEIKPPRIIIEFPDLVGREPFIIWDREDAIRMWHEMEIAIGAFVE